MHTKLILPLIAVAAAAVLTSCSPKPTSGKGLRLPDGDFDRGKASFVDLKCHRCHTVKGVELPASEDEGWGPPLELGGTVYRVKTYGELITAITNPDHIISKKFKDRLAGVENSPMPPMNDDITVGQLIDLVKFLNSQYVEYQPDYDDYYIMP